MDELIESWELSLRADRKAEKTRRLYLGAVRLLQAHMVAAGVTEPTKDAVRRFLADRGEQVTAATTSLEFRALQQFFKWLAAEGEGVNVMLDLNPPAVPDKPVPVLSLDDLRLLLKTCDGTSFTDRRDTALIRLFADTGARLSEITNLELGDLDLPGRLVRVVGKGDRERFVPIGAKTVAALDRYRRARARHPFAAERAFWLGHHSGAMIPSGVYQALRKRARTVGLVDFHPHQLRHTFAHQWLADGGTEGDLMMLAGWRSPSMLRRYGASAAAMRARAAHAKLGLGDQI